MMNLERLKAGVRNNRNVALYGAQLRLRILSEEELLQCRVDSLAHANKTGLDDEGVMIDQVLRQLYLALDDGEGNKLAGSVADFKRQLTRAERDYLTGEYLALERECSPALENMSEEEFIAAVEEIKKNPDSILRASNIDTLRKLVRYLANRPAN